MKLAIFVAALAAIVIFVLMHSFFVMRALDMVVIMVGACASLYVLALLVGKPRP